MDETHRAKECATLGQWSDNAGGQVENRIWYHFLEGRVFLICLYNLVLMFMLFTLMLKLLFMLILMI